MSLYAPYGAAQMRISIPLFCVSRNLKFSGSHVQINPLSVLYLEQFLLHIVFTEIAPIAYLQNQQS